MVFCYYGSSQILPKENILKKLPACGSGSLVRARVYRVIVVNTRSRVTIMCNIHLDKHND